MCFVDVLIVEHNISFMKDHNKKKSSTRYIYQLRSRFNGCFCIYISIHIQILLAACLHLHTNNTFIPCKADMSEKSNFTNELLFGYFFVSSQNML